MSTPHNPNSFGSNIGDTVNMHAKQSEVDLTERGVFEVQLDIPANIKSLLADTGIPTMNVSELSLHDEVGRGGTATVHRGLYCGNEIAMKVLHANFRKNTYVETFVREMFLHHGPRTAVGICGQLIEYGCYAMDTVCDGSLQSMCKEGRLNSPQKRVRACVQSTIAVQGVTEQSMIHGDVKPKNLLYRDGLEQVYITDFGHAAHAESALSANISVTPLYAAPEQLSFTEKNADVKTDVYALGMTMFFLLNPHHVELPQTVCPHDDAMRTIQIIIDRTGYNEAIADLARQYSPTVEKIIEDLLQGCLAQAPESRWQIAQVLEACMDIEGNM